MNNWEEKLNEIRLFKTAERLYNLDSFEAADNGESLESIAHTIQAQPLHIINFLLDIIDELQE